MSEETDLSSRLQTVIDEIRDVMEKRKERSRNYVRKLPILSAITKNLSARLLSY